jgi:hypothetical protein
LLLIRHRRPSRSLCFALQLYELGYVKDLSASPNAGNYGVDISSFISPGTFGCMKNNNYHFAIARQFMQTCRVDPNGVHTVANAWAAGLAHVDIYLFPSFVHILSPQPCVGMCLRAVGE